MINTGRKHYKYIINQTSFCLNKNLDVNYIRHFDKNTVPSKLIHWYMHIESKRFEWILTPVISTALYKTFRQNRDIHVHMDIGHKKLPNVKKKSLQWLTRRRMHNKKNH